MPRAPHPTFGELVRVFARIGCLSFGGPAGQIALMHRIVVLERRWIGEARFLHALSYCTLLPGPEAQQLATYVGWLLHKTRGGLAAGLLFIAPGALVMLALSWLYVSAADVGVVRGVLFGIKCAVVAIVVEALVRVARRAVRGAPSIVLACAAFAVLAFTTVPFPIVVASALLVGALGTRLAPRAFAPAEHAGDARGLADEDDALGPELPAHARPSLARTLRTTLVGIGVWILPLVAVGAAFGSASVFADQARFFGRAALVTFGGAYAVLAYVAEHAVERFAWLEPGQMLDGLGLAETTPGPLILVLQFVGYVGAFRHPGELAPHAAGALGALVVLWATFAPCFVWIFAGAPWVERVRASPAASGALAAVTAAVVGVIAHLSLWFALHVFFGETSTVERGPLRATFPVWSTIDVLAIGLAGVALALLLTRRVGVPLLVALAALAGALVR